MAKPGFAVRPAKKKRPPLREAPGLFVNRPKLRLAHVLGLQSLGTLLHLELHLRTFVQATVAVGLDGGKVNEHIVAARSLDKSIAFGGIEPLHDTFFPHYTSPEIKSFVVLLGLSGKESGLSRLAKDFRGASKQPCYLLETA
jgi:hypothetical protein